MKGKYLVGIFIVLLIVLINACENKSVPVPKVVLSKSCDTLSITYSSGTNNIKPIIDAECGTGNTSCHSAGSVSGYDFSSYSAGGLQTANSRNYIYTSLFMGTPHQMPLTAAAGWSDSNTCMLAKFKAWIDAGIPQ